MNRLRRWLFTLVAGVSAVICFASAGLWILSYRFPYHSYVQTTRWVSVQSNGKTVSSPEYRQWRSERGHLQIMRVRMVPKYGADGSVALSDRVESIWVVYWVLALASAPLPVIWATVLRRRRIRESRIHDGKYATCGYDLRATPDRCPECGAVPETAKGAAG